MLIKESGVIKSKGLGNRVGLLNKRSGVIKPAGLMHNRRAQAILPFFGLQLISIMIFFIVLLTLLTMSKNVNMVVNEFDEQTAFLLASRRMFSSADCLAAEEVDAIYDPISKQVITGKRVLPGVVDRNKLFDFENFNCMRKDLYDKKSEVEKGLWDASIGSGATFRYGLVAFDAETKTFLHNSTDVEGFRAYYLNSFIGRVNKIEFNCNDDLLTDVCQDRYGKSWDCIQIGDNNIKGHVGGRCQNQVGERIWWTLGTQQAAGGKEPVRPYWKIDDPEYTVYPVDGADVENKYNHIDLHQYDDTCATENNTRRGVFPVLMQIDNSLHPTYILFESCVKQGTKYEGRNILTITVKPKAGSECV
jgi:hypothetical protein